MAVTKPYRGRLRTLGVGSDWHFLATVGDGLRLTVLVHPGDSVVIAEAGDLTDGRIVSGDTWSFPGPGSFYARTDDPHPVLITVTTEHRPERLAAWLDLLDQWRPNND